MKFCPFPLGQGLKSFTIQKKVDCDIDYVPPQIDDVSCNGPSRGKREGWSDCWTDKVLCRTRGRQGFTAGLGPGPQKGL